MLIASDSFGQVSAAGWGAADLGGNWLHRYGGNTDATSAASADGAVGRMSVTSTSGLKVMVSSLGASTLADVDLVATVRAEQTAGAYLMVVGRVVDANRFYAAQINLQSNSFSIRRNNNSIWATLAAGPAPATPFAANTDYTIRLQLQGTTLRARWWPTGQAEPSVWAAQTTDSMFATGQVGVASAVTISATTIVSSFDDFQARQ